MTAPNALGPSHYRGLRSHSDTIHSVGLLWMSDQPVAETSTREHNTHKRQAIMPPAGYEPTVLASGRPQTQALNRAAFGIGTLLTW